MSLSTETLSQDNPTTVRRGPGSSPTKSTTHSNDLDPSSKHDNTVVPNIFPTEVPTLQVTEVGHHDSVSSRNSDDPELRTI